VRNATKIFIRLPGGAGSWANIHALDPRSDLAVLEMIDCPRELHPVTFGNGGKLRKGQFVIGLSNYYAAGCRDGSPSASLGIVSNLRRRAPGELKSESDRALQSFHRYGTLIQTDVRIGLGCSGGALLDLNGEVIGITSALAALTGIEAPGGFAVPVDAKMKEIIKILARGEEVEYGLLGVILSPQMQGSGADIHSTTYSGPANRAGVNGGDRIVAINETPVRNNDDLFLLISSLTAGSEARLVVRRGGIEQHLPPVRLAKLYVSTPPLVSSRPEAIGGLRVDYASILSNRSDSRHLFDSVVIREIVPSSPAARIDVLQPNRLISRVNGIPVTTPAAFYQAMKRAGQNAVLTVINPEEEEVTVTLPLR
jgi:serine protease Do